MRKTSLSIAVGLALAQFIPAPVTAADTTEDFIEVNTSISLDDTTKAQTKTLNYDKNVIYTHNGKIALRKLFKSPL